MTARYRRIGTARFVGTITVTGRDTFEGVMTAEYYLGPYLLPPGAARLPRPAASSLADRA